MQKNKKQRYEKELKQGLITVQNLSPHLLSPLDQSHLTKTYPQITMINSLRIVTVYEIIYLLELYLDLIEKDHPSFLSQFKIGLIGGGINCRIILNSILALSKDGINLKNITVSTRQPENFKSYCQNFGINAIFDNQQTAKDSDFLVICTPATLDNYILRDLNQSLQIRSKAYQRNEKNAVNISQIGKLMSEKSHLTHSNQSIAFSQTKKKGAQLENSFGSEPIQVTKRPFNPLVYVLTSDISSKKCDKIFKIPVLTPSIRAKDMITIANKLKQLSSDTSQVNEHQRVIGWWLTREQQEQNRDSLPSRQSTFGLEGQYPAAISKFSKTPFMRILKIFSFVIKGPVNLVSLTSSISNTISLNQSIKDKIKQQQISQAMEIATSHGDIADTFLSKIKKWQMAYSNYIS